MDKRLKPCKKEIESKFLNACLDEDSHKLCHGASQKVQKIWKRLIVITEK